MKIIFVRLSVFLLVALWTYAAAAKLMDFGQFKVEMHRQALYPFLQTLMIHFLPPAELFTAVLMVFERTLKAGLYLSLALMTLFTGYITLSILHFFGHVPCSCGGILEKMGWQAHLYFNLFFLLITITTLIILKKKGGMVTKTN